MATSGSTDFTLNRNEMINAAFRQIGVGVRGETLSSEMIADGSEALNLLLKSWDAYGLPLWRRDKLSVTLVASQASYTIGLSGADVTAARPLRLLEANYKDSSGYTAPVTILTLNEWASLSDRTSTTSSAPVNVYFDPTLSLATLHVWQIPNATSAAEYTLEIWVHSPVEDMDASTNTFDCPPEWLKAIRDNLALELADEYGTEDQHYYRIRNKAEKSLKLALEWDVEDRSVLFQPSDY